MRRPSCLGLIVMLGCAAEPPAPSREPPMTPVVEATPTPTATPAAAPSPEQIVLSPAVARVKMTEVLLDPRGQAAITLDRDGGAALWPDLRGTETPTPVVLPLREAAWVTLASAGEGRLVIAATDTAGGTRVGQVELGTGGARWQTLFELPATDPVLEIHVLAGGDRILALGLDHRIRLYDRHGTPLSILVAPGFIPWQLRVAQPAGAAPVILAVLAGPVRVQAIALTGDTLALTGEARGVALEKGPNLSDLALSPDGTFVTALRRPRSKGRAWALERIDLASGERRWLGGDVDTTVRPRVHLVDPTRALLESGSGKGFWIDLTSAQAPAPGTIIDRAKLPRTPARVVPLAGSTEDTRMWSTVADGIRAVAVDEVLLVDALATDDHLRFAAETFDPSRVAIEATGERIAWFTGMFELWVETIGEVGPPRKLAAFDNALDELVFVDRERLLAVDHVGEVTLRRFSDGEVLARTRVQAAWGVGTVAYRSYHGTGAGQGAVAIRGGRGGEPVVQVAVTATGLGAPRKPTAAELVVWPEFGGAGFVAAQAALRASTGRAGLVVADLEIAVDRRWLLARDPNDWLFELRGDRAQGVEIERGAVSTWTPAPGASRVAVLHHVTQRGMRLIRVIDLGGEAPRVLWSRTLEGAWNMRWSDDGARLAVASDGAYVFDGTTGAVLLERHHLGLTAVRRPDSDKPPPAE